MPRQRGGVTVGSSVSEAAMASAVTTIQNQSSVCCPARLPIRQPRAVSPYRQSWISR